jgi:transcriptional regulator with XRE-family HTH domain
MKTNAVMQSKEGRTTRRDAGEAGVKAPVSGNPLRGLPRPEPVQPWDGTLSQEELVRDTPAAPLLSMLYGRAAQLGHSANRMCEELGITYGYVSLLRNNQRDVDKVSDALVENVAAYLGVPKLQVMVAAGKVRPEDLFADPPSVDVYLKQAIAHMRGDPVWGPHVAKSIEAVPVEVQFLCIALFEAATGKNLLPQRRTNEDIAKHALQLAATRERLMQDMQRGERAG